MTPGTRGAEGQSGGPGFAGEPVRPITGAALVAVLAFFAYSATLSGHPSWDALRYAGHIATDEPAGLASAHHALGGLLAYGFHRGQSYLGQGGEALLSLQLTSAAAGALALSLLFVILRSVGGSAGAATATCVGLGGSLAFWEVATDGEVYTSAAATLVAAWWLLLEGVKRGVPTVAAAGGAAAIAVLAHQFNAALPLWAWLPLRRCPRPGLALLTYSLAFGITLAAGYAVAHQVSGWGQSWGGFFAWATHYLRLGFDWQGETSAGGVLGGLTMSLVAFPSLASGTASTVAGGSLLAAVVILTAFFALCVVVIATASRTTGRHSAGVALLVALTAASLAAWWEPGTRKFWVPALVSGWLAIGLALIGSPARRVAAFGFIAAAIAILNLGVAVLPRADGSRDPFPAAARRIAAATAEQDLIIVGTDMLGPNLAYYGRRPHTTNLFAILLEARRQGRDARKRLAGVVGRKLRQGGQVFLTSDALDIPRNHRAAIEPLPTTLGELLPRTEMQPVMTYSLGAAERVLFRVVLPGSRPPEPRDGIRHPSALPGS